MAPSLANAAHYFADENTPKVPVYDNHPTCANKIVMVPIPAGAKTPHQLNTNNKEPKMTVMQRGTGIEWSFYKPSGPEETPLVAAGGVQCPNNRHWQAAIIEEFDPALNEGGWLGLGNEVCCSGAESKVYYPVGTVRPRDTRLTGVQPWPHALSGGAGFAANFWVYPAKGGSGICRDYTKCIPFGGRLQLDPSFDCAGTTLLLYTWERQACRTLQVYGWILVDKGCLWPCGGIGYKSSNPYAVKLNLGNYVDGGGNYTFPYDSSQYRRMPAGVLQHLRVVNWNVWTGAPGQ
jgi:hypothetical protein